MTFLTPAIMAGEDWRALELAVARLMSHCGWHAVQDVAQSGDKGADILAVRPMEVSGNDDTFLVQVKSVQTGAYVGVAAVNQAITAQGYYGARTVVVATNGDFHESARRRAAELSKQGFRVRLWNGLFLKELLSKWPKYSAQKSLLREYQEIVCDSVMTSASAGRTKHLFVLATGLGKTTVASALADRFFQRGYRKILVLCHAVDLAAQLQREFWKQLSRDIPTRIFTDGEPPVPIEGVNFGLYQTMYNYLGGIEKGSFDLIIVDEAHHALGNAFTLCVEHLAPRLLIGMTATPWRGDGRRVEDLFGEPQVTLSLVDGMKMGYLAQVDYRLMCDNIDWGQLADLAGRPVSIKELNKRIFLPQRDDAVIDEIVKLGSEVKHPRIAVFSPSVSHAEEFAIKLNARGVKAANLSIPDKVRRRSLLMEFSAGGLSAITAVDVLNEGIDVPEVNVVVFLRATHSRRIFVQQLGRGLRIAPGKERVVVLDFVSDLRRLSALHQMQGEFTKALKSRPEQIWLPVEVVSFSSVRTRAFVDAWLNDGEDIQDADEQSSITFPEIV